MKILGLIIARGGSKRIPRKNINNFLGKPLLAWSIKVGQQSKVFDKFILSTDDKEIAKIGKRYGIEIPFLRPKNLAKDTTPALPVIKQAVEWLKKNENYKPDWVILLEPSSPGRQFFHIQEVVGIIKRQSGKINSIVGISEVPAHFSPFKALKLLKNGNLVRHDSVKVKDLIHRNQDVPQLYYINGNIYAFKISNLFSKDPSLWGNRVKAYLMDNKYSMDIDTPEEWQIAELKMKSLIKNKKG